MGFEPFPSFIANTAKTTVISSLQEALINDCTLDIITSSFEVASLIWLENWQSVRKMRILIGSPEKPENKTAFLQHLFISDEQSIESAKQQNDDLSILAEVRDAIKAGKIEIRGYLREKLNASVYLVTHPSGNQAGLIGSSDFTASGLRYGIELNGSLPETGCKEIASFFELLYAKSEDIGSEIIRHIERHIRPYSPYEVYLKSLYEYFRGREIPTTVWEEEESRMYQILSEYQRDAYRQLLRIADRYKGAMLCDGVGLGKTFVALMLIERLIHDRKRVVVIVPKSAREAIWETAIRRYIPEARGVFGNQVVLYNHTDLLRGSSADRDFPAEFREIRDHADVIIIDEAHHFRTSSANRSQKLYELTKNKLVFLLTATPINNTLFDLQHLMEYFTRKDDGRFAHLGINSIRGYLIQKEKLIEERMQASPAFAESEGTLYADFDTVSADQILNDDRLFREVVVQRSRSYVKEREKLSDRQTLFPKRQPPEVAAYSIKATYGALLDDIRDAFDRDDPKLKLAVYNPMAYAFHPDDLPQARFEENRQMQIVGLVRTMLLKRFESSWKAFQYTCEDLLLKLAASVRKQDEKLYGKWRAANTLWMVDIEQHLRERYDTGQGSEEQEEEDILETFAEDMPALDTRLYDVKSIIRDTMDDMDLLVRFLNHVKHSSSETDDKFQTLLRMLKNHPLLSQQKVVVFSEFRDTARYLQKSLREAGIRNLEQIDSSSKLDRLEVIRRFSPFYNYEDSEKHQKALTNPIRVLISTDVLSEGLNLQDAFLLINYDLHWNPVRLMQRIGRVDRRMNPETEAAILEANPDQKDLRRRVWFWNFLPPQELNDVLSLYQRVAHKVLKISETTGLEGAQLLTPEDHYNTLKNFNEAYEGRPSTEERLRLLLNQALRDDPNLEKQLVEFPWRIFSSKDHRVTQGLFACYRLPSLGVADPDTVAGELRWYFLPEGSTQVLTTIEEIDRFIACEPAEAGVEPRPLPERYERLKIIDQFIKSNELKRRKATTMAQVAGGVNESNKLQLVGWMELV